MRGVQRVVGCLLLTLASTASAKDGLKKGDEVDQRWWAAAAFFEDLPPEVLAGTYRKQTRVDCPGGAKPPACEGLGSKTAFGMNLLHVRLEAARKAQATSHPIRCYKLAYAAALTAAGLPGFREVMKRQHQWSAGSTYLTRWDGTLTEDQLFGKVAQELEEAKKLYAACGGPTPFPGIPDPFQNYTSGGELMAGTVLQNRMISFFIGEEPAATKWKVVVQAPEPEGPAPGPSRNQNRKRRGGGGGGEARGGDDEPAADSSSSSPAAEPAAAKPCLGKHQICQENTDCCSGDCTLDTSVDTIHDVCE
jgi:hypothetical protein